MNPTAGRIQHVIDALDYHFEAFELTHFLNHLECLRRRELVLMAARFSPRLSGVWIKAETADYVFYPADSHAVYRVHSILHEIGHILLGHACRPIESFLPPALLTHFGKPPPVGRLRQVSSPMSDAEEQACELFVALFQRNIVRADRLHALIDPQSSIPAFKRYIQSGA